MKNMYSISEKNKLGDDIRYVRKLLNMNQTIFGQFTGVSYKTVYRAEISSNVSKNFLAKIFDAISNVLNDKQLTFGMDQYKIEELNKFKEKIINIIER